MMKKNIIWVFLFTSIFVLSCNESRKNNTIKNNKIESDSSSTNNVKHIKTIMENKIELNKSSLTFINTKNGFKLYIINSKCNISEIVMDSKFNGIKIDCIDSSSFKYTFVNVNKPTGEPISKVQVDCGFRCYGIKNSSPNDFAIIGEGNIRGNINDTHVPNGTGIVVSGNASVTYYVIGDNFYQKTSTSLGGAIFNPLCSF